MTTLEKKLFTKKERMELLISLQTENIKMYNSLLSRMELKYPISDQELINNTKNKINLLVNRLNKLTAKSKK